MAQHDYNVANGSGAAVRADINALAEAIASLNSGTSAPSVTFPNMQWYDSANALLKMRNPGNTAWMTIASIAGSVFQFDASTFPATLIRERLTGARTYYVRSDGDDAHNGLTNSSGGAFLTVQKAIDTVTKNLDLNGQIVSIQIGAGTFTGGAVNGVIVGQQSISQFLITGDTTTPSNVILTGGISAANYAAVSVEGFKTGGSAGLLARNFGRIKVTNKIDFGNSGLHMSARNALIDISGITYTISAAATAHFYAHELGSIFADSSVVTVTGTPAITIFADVAFQSYLYAASAGYTGAATGQRYNANNGSINTNAGGATFFPGNAGGATSNGGQYF